MEKNTKTTNNMTVDAFVKAKVRPELQAIVAMLRKLMRECAPDAKEQISYGIPMWKAKRIIVYLNPTKTDITFGFSRGGQFIDKYKLLGGLGKVSKHVKIKSVKEANMDALRYYIKQAVKIDAKR